MHDFAGRGVRQGINDVVDARPLVRGQHGTVRAVLLQLLNGEGGIARHNICRNDFAAQLVRRTDNGALCDLGMVVQHGLDLRRIDVLAGGNDHIVLAAAHGDELVLVPCADIAGVQKALVELLFGHFRVIIVTKCALCRRGNDNLALGHVVVRDQIVRLGMGAVLAQLYDADLVIRTRAAGRACVIRQVERAQKCVPEGFRRAVAVENVRREQLHVLLACALFKRRAHGDNAAQRGQVVRGALLRAGEHGNDGRYTDQERNVVLRGIFQAALRCKIAQNDNFTARIEGRARAAGVDAAAVEPRGHVHRAVGRTEREVHHNVMRGKHLVDIVDRHALRTVGCAGSVQTGGLVVDVRVEVDRRVVLRLIGNVIRIAHLTGRYGIIRADNDLDSRLALAQVERTAGQLAELGVVDESFGRAVINDECNLACALPVVDRTRDRTNLVRRQIAENKLRRIEQGEHDNIVLADAVRAQRLRQTVGFGVQFAVGPAAAGMRVKECRSAAETRNIAQKTVQIGETGFKCVAEHGNIIGVFVTQGITS